MPVDKIAFNSELWANVRANCALVTAHEAVSLTSIASKGRFRKTAPAISVNLERQATFAHLIDTIWWTQGVATCFEGLCIASVRKSSWLATGAGYDGYERAFEEKSELPGQR